MNDLRIGIDEWTGTGQGSAEEVATRGFLRIEANDVCLTRNDNSWSRSVSDRVHVSMYPVALWLTANWWRLCFEAPRRNDVDSYDWRASHDMPAAGHGYLWPPLRITPDGETVVFEVLPARRGAKEPIRYIEQAKIPLPLPGFEQACGTFIATVVARLREERISGTALEQLWAEVEAERSDSATARARRYEAMLHCDPDEAPVAAIGALEDLVGESGFEASVELAGALRGDELPAALERLRAAGVNGSGLRARWDRAEHSGSLSACRSAAEDRSYPPWKRGMATARALRTAWRLDDSPIPTDVVETRMQLARGALAAVAPAPPALARSAPVGLGIEQGAELRLLLRSSSARGRRFETARLIGDLLGSRADDAWHPVTELHTARQQFQRAFAAEFLCPVAGLEGFLGGDHSEDAIVAAADHFEVSELAVEHQMTNHLRRREG